MQVVHDWFVQIGWSPATATAAAVAASIAVAYGVGRIIRALAKAPLLKKLKRLDEWREAISHRHVLSRTSNIVVIVLTSILVPPLLEAWSQLQDLTDDLLDILLIIAFTRATGAITWALVDVLSQRDSKEQRLPFKALGQALQIFIWTYASVTLLSVITETDVASVLTGLTAIGAVLVYVFRDPILGWSAGLQMAANDLVRVGDWITVPKHGADGNVEEIALTTVKVRNWDKTINTIPTYSLVSEGFQNWRGMYASRMRRIKRAIPIDADSVRFCEPELLERLASDPLMQAILHPADEVEDPVPGKSEPAAVPGANSLSDMRPTNLGCYRAWLEAWIKKHPKIDRSGLNMVRELALDGRGIPVEVYAFSKDQRWEYYEKLQAEIIDHAVAVLPAFDLRLFQEPTGSDLRSARHQDR